MKMKKLMSICAMSLAVVCCTSVTTFAAQNNESRSKAAQQVAMNFWKNGYVIDGIKININTPINNYATNKLIGEFKGLGTEIGVTFDETKGIKENLEKITEDKDKLKTEENLKTIKDFVKNKLTDYENKAKEGKLDDCIREDFKVNYYGTLTVGKNMNGKATATLEDKRGNILFQVNSENIYNMKSELSGINSWSDLKTWMSNYVDVSIFDGLKALNK